jgi:hypothetical protein
VGSGPAAAKLRLVPGRLGSTRLPDPLQEIIVQPKRIMLTLAAGLLAACAAAPQAESGPAAAREATRARPDLSGTWDFSVDMGERVTTGELSLQRAPQGYAGTIMPEGSSALPVRSLTLAGDSITMIVETPEGPVTFEGALGSDARGMRGIVHYHGGQDLPLNARKRE